MRVSGKSHECTMLLSVLQIVVQEQKASVKILSRTVRSFSWKRVARSRPKGEENDPKLPNDSG